MQQKQMAEDGSSPHTRGALNGANIGYKARRIIPAYAGSTGPGATRSTGRKDHPRIRGEHLLAARGYPALRGSSPHTRGALRPEYLPKGGVGIIPAYAGSTSFEPSFHGGLTGSSPHTRGALPIGDWNSATRADHPRIRGEHHCHLRPVFERIGIIPAYAGSTPPRGERTRRRPDHPRIRGEHVVPPTESTTYGGSSPHTRGALMSTAESGSYCRDHPRIRGEHRQSEPQAAIP